MLARVPPARLLLILVVGSCANVSSTTPGTGGQGGGSVVVADAGVTHIDMAPPDLRTPTSDASCGVTGTPACNLCGNGMLNAPEESCDDGVNDGRYGGCLPGCHGLGPFCGDSKVELTVEACDDGRNLSTYGQTGCSPGCRIVPRCGDGHVDSVWNESCDDANQSSLDGCSSDCRIEVQ
jgi:cysteine-rich repeat protein